MNAAANAVPDPEVVQYLKIWTDCIAQVLGQIAGATFNMELLSAAPAEAAPVDAQDLLAVVAAAGSLRGKMSVRLPRAAVLGLGQLFLSETQDAAAELKPDHRDAVEELLRQVAGQVATALNERWGEVQLRVETSTAPTWSAGAGGWMASTAEAPYRFLMEWQLSAALVAALRPAPAASQPGPAAQEPTAAPKTAPVAPRQPVPSEEKLELLMDVELDVTLRFGARRMLLREILELDAGAVVQLDREVQEPADLLLDGKLIARGDVVIVDGNYGLRVTEVVSTPLSR